jgi:hypothetical protein
MLLVRDVMPCGLVETFYHFGGVCCLSLHGMLVYAMGLQPTARQVVLCGTLPRV